MRCNWAHVLTTLRLLLILPITLAVLAGETAWILVLYVAGALTDCLDGWIARRSGTASAFGAKYDALADMMFFVFVFVWLLLLFPEETTFVLAMFVLVIVSLLVNGVVALLLHGALLSPHLQSGRIAAVFFYAMFPAIVLFGHPVSILGTATAGLLISRVHTIVHIVRTRPAQAG